MSDHPVVMTIHAAISRRSWSEVEQAANKLRDHEQPKWQAAADRIATLEAALRRYAHHTSDCRYRGGHDCDCGLDEIRTTLATEQDTQPRKTFTIPPGYEAVRDSEGRATGEVRPRATIATEQDK